tara:strand:- start:1079 stop:1684 length:606 start_codon:yes stop_codon:yes gene_type:complete
MVNYYSGFLVSLVLHLALILSLTNLFKIKDLYSLNAFESMPVYLVYENKVKERNINSVKTKVSRIENKKVQVNKPGINLSNISAEKEVLKLEKDIINLELEKITKSDEISLFSSIIQNQVMQVWQQPSSARTGLSVELLIKLVPTGEIIDVKLLKSSGNLAFDNSALNAVEKLSKFEDLNMGRKLFDNHFRNFTLVFNPKN